MNDMETMKAVHDGAAAQGFRTRFAKLPTLERGWSPYTWRFAIETDDTIYFGVAMTDLSEASDVLSEAHRWLLERAAAPRTHCTQHMSYVRACLWCQSAERSWKAATRNYRTKGME